MKRLIAVLLLVAMSLTFGCYIIFVEHPDSGLVGSTIDIEMLIAADPEGAGAVTPVACIGIPESWNVTGAAYSALVDGTVPVSGSGTPDPVAAGDIAGEFPTSTGGELVAWQCYSGAYTDYGIMTLGTVTFQVQVGSAGIFTLRYSAGSVSSGPDYSLAERRFATDGSLDDLDNWRNSNYGPAAQWTNLSVAYGDGKYVAAAASRLSLTDFQVITSTNGLDWAETATPASFEPASVTYGADGFVMVGASGQIATSPDGAGWSVTTAGSTDYSDVVYGSGQYVAVGDSSTVALSPDGTTWSTGLVSGSTVTLNGIDYANGTFCAVGITEGNTSASFTTDDGAHWGGSTLGLTQPLFDVAYGNGTFLAVGALGTILRSSTCTGGWTTATSGTIDNLFSVEYADGSFVATGNQGTLLTSPDGVNWTVRKPGVFGDLLDIISAKGGFVVVGDYGVVLLSSGVDTSTGGGGGGGGGCSTAGPAPGEPMWPEMLWIAMLGVVFLLWRRKRVL